MESRPKKTSHGYVFGVRLFFYALSTLITGIAGLSLIIVYAAQTANVGITVQARSSLCQDENDNDGDFLTDYSADNWCDSINDDDENVTGTETHATSDFTIAGGTVSFNNNDSLAIDFSFPANFYSGSVRLFANSYANSFFSSNQPSPSGKSFIGKTYDFLLYVISSEAQLNSTSQTVTITLRYLAADIGESISESTIRPYVWDSANSEWDLITDSTLNTSGNSISFSTTSFGSFALFGSAAAAETPSGGAAGGGFKFEIPFIKKPPKVITPEFPGCGSVDFNCDGHVNIRDMSILLYYWDKRISEAEQYDLNQDGKMGIEDVSILLYYWTD